MNVETISPAFYADAKRTRAALFAAKVISELEK